MSRWKPGDRVRVVDGSEAHGDLGAVWLVQDNGIVMVELDGYGSLWPILEDRELEAALEART